MNNQYERLNLSTDQDKKLEAYKAIVAMDQQKESFKEKENFWKAYLWSVLIPPIGVYYFIKYFFFDDATSDRRKAGVISLVLTIISLIVNVWLIQVFFSQTIGGNNQNLNTLEELITPGDRNDLQKLLQ